MMKKVSLKDIANKVGVSTALVSYVLNNQKEGRIRKEVAQRIRDTAKQLNYRTNLAARSLKTNKTFTIGLVVADISNSYFSSLARIIEDAADQNNYTVIFGSSDENSKKSGKLIETLLNRQVDGLIISPPENSECQVESLIQEDIPFVLIDRYFPTIKTNYVAIDNYKSAFEATTHLRETGRKKIGMITYESSIITLTERTRGYQAALKEQGISFNKNWLKEIDADNTGKSVEKAIDELLKGPEVIDALLFSSNILAVAGLKNINSLSLKVPDDLAIISFDETEAFDLFYAPLTYIKQPLQEIGQMATRILLQNIEKPQELTQLNIDAKLITRESTRVSASST
jgi:LacI family transcriptional regulator